MGSLLHTVQHEATGVNAMVTRASLRAVHVALEFTEDFTVDDLGIAATATHDSDTVSGVNSSKSGTTVDLRGASEHDRGFSHLVGDEVCDFRARLTDVQRNGSVS